LNTDRIREFRMGDIQGIKRVFRSWWAGEDRRITELTETTYFDPNGLFVAERNKEILGFSYAYVDPRIINKPGRKLGFLSGIFTLPHIPEVAVRLLERSTQYLRELKATEIGIPDFSNSLGDGVSAERDSELYRLYRDAGFSIYTHSYQMSRSLEDLAVPQWVKNRREAILADGFLLRKAKKDDARALIELSEEAFKESHDHIPKSKDDRELAMKEMDLRIAKTVLFENDCRVVGSSDFSIEKYGKVVVGYPCVAVLPTYRNKGLGTVLFWDTLGRLKESGMSIAAVSVVSKNYPAVHMYRKAGFNIDKIWYHLRKNI